MFKDQKRVIPFLDTCIDLVLKHRILRGALPGLLASSDEVHGVMLFHSSLLLMSAAQAP